MELTNFEKIELNGETYTRTKRHWVDSHFCIVPLEIENKINVFLASRNDFLKMSVDELINEGDKFKNTGAAGLAIKHYNAALAKSDSFEKKYILPRISSAYRIQGNSIKAIELYKEYENDDGIITSALLTSISAAYCDLGDNENAINCAHKAQAHNLGIVSRELLNVYERISGCIC